MSEIELGVIVLPTLQMGDLSGDTLTVTVSLSLKSRVQWEVLVNQRAMKADTILLQSCSNVWRVTGRRQCNPKRIDMHANSDTDDSCRLRVSKKKPTTVCNEKKRYLALTFLSLYSLI